MKGNFASLHSPGLYSCPLSWRSYIRVLYPCPLYCVLILPHVLVAQGRPADNPLIVHVSSLAMLRGLYEDVDDVGEGGGGRGGGAADGATDGAAGGRAGGTAASGAPGAASATARWQLPEAYLAAVAEAWPGPLTVLLPRSPKVSCAAGGAVVGGMSPARGRTQSRSVHSRSEVVGWRAWGRASLVQSRI
jgi:hypothetical protein